MGCFSFKPDPGPCPVDDTPHTACTPESVAASMQLTISGSARVSFSVPIAAPRDVPPKPAPVEFTTKTYRRAVHNPRVKR